MHVINSPFFFLPPSALVALPLPRVTFSLGMLSVCGSGLGYVVSLGRAGIVAEVREVRGRIVRV